MCGVRPMRDEDKKKAWIHHQDEFRHSKFMIGVKRACDSDGWSGRQGGLTPPGGDKGTDTEHGQSIG